MSADEREQGRFEGEVLSRLETIDNRLEKMEGLETRIRALEHVQVKLKAWATLAGAGLAMAGQWLLKQLGHQ